MEAGEESTIKRSLGMQNPALERVSMGCEFLVGVRGDDELMNILLTPRWLSQVKGGDVVSSKFPLHGDCKVYRTRRTPRINK